MRQLYSNDSVFDSLGIFYAVISSTQGGWTWLSSEGRYMGATAYGNGDRKTNPYYAALKPIFSLQPEGRIYINRDLANWPRDIMHHPYTAELIRILGRADRASGHVEPGRGAARRGHRAQGEHAGAARQGGGDADGVRGRPHARHRTLHPLDRQRPAGADRRHRAQRARQHAAAGAFRRELLPARTGTTNAAASVGAAGAERCRRHHRRGLYGRLSRRLRHRADVRARLLLRRAAGRARHSRGAESAAGRGMDRADLGKKRACARAVRRLYGLHDRARRDLRALPGRRRDRPARARPSLDPGQSVQSEDARES